MSSNYQRLRALTKFSASEKDQLWRFLSSKVVRVVTAAAVALIVPLLWLGHSQEYGPSYAQNNNAALSSKHHSDSSSSRTNKGRLHLVVPATSSNPDLCKLMLSAQILGYPTPVLINYGDKEAADPYVQHLAKVEGTLRYLDKLETSDEWQEDLVLVVDGYDIWFQLKPDVLLKRFYEINAAADARVRKRFGEDFANQHGMRQTVVFGPDKLCWPVDFSRPACWAIPDSTLPDDIYGPPPVVHEDRDKNPARWLNSGTVLGAAQDVRAIFRATLWSIQRNHTTDSDQYYFAEVFGEQEYARLQKRPDLLEQQKKKVLFDHEDPSGGEQIRLEPEPSDNRTEFHIGIDYESSMFQTIAFWKQHMTWTRAVNSWTPPNPKKVSPIQPYTINLAQDIQESAEPFEAVKSGLELSTYPQWEDVSLAYNVLTRQHPVLFHVTGDPHEKQFRQYMWHKIWFQSRAEELRLATFGLPPNPISNEKIGGLYWYNAEGGDDAIEIDHNGKDGAWTDRRGWLSWKRLCKPFEEQLYGKPDEDYYHREWQAELVRIMEVHGTEPEYPVLKYYHTASDKIAGPTATYWPATPIETVAATGMAAARVTPVPVSPAERPKPPTNRPGIAPIPQADAPIWPAAGHMPGSGRA